MWSGGVGAEYVPICTFRIKYPSAILANRWPGHAARPCTGRCLLVSSTFLMSLSGAYICDSAASINAISAVLRSKNISQICRLVLRHRTRISAAPRHWISATSPQPYSPAFGNMECFYKESIVIRNLMFGVSLWAGIMPQIQALCCIVCRSRVYRYGFTAHSTLNSFRLISLICTAI